jgi:GAF domain-containing protein
MNHLQDQNLASEVRRLLLSIEATGKSVLPLSNDDLLRSIVEAAKRIFGAAAASIALVNENKQTLDFKVAVGIGNKSVTGMSIPLNKGIAGYVAMTGQPIAISNLQQDTRFNKDFAQSTGYVPHSILATPLLHNDQVIGVMEVLDKINAPSFGMQDMELLGIFAQQASIAIFQSNQVEQLGQTLLGGLRELAAESGSDPDFHKLFQTLESAGLSGEESQDLLKLARLFNEISAIGEAERKACVEILTVFANYGNTKSRRSRQRK